MNYELKAWNAHGMQTVPGGDDWSGVVLIRPEGKPGYMVWVDAEETIRLYHVSGDMNQGEAFAQITRAEADAVAQQKRPLRHFRPGDGNSSCPVKGERWKLIRAAERVLGLRAADDFDPAEFEFMDPEDPNQMTFAFGGTDVAQDGQEAQQVHEAEEPPAQVAEAAEVDIPF